MRLRNWFGPGGPTWPIDLALRLTLIELLLRPMGPWYVRAVMLLLAMLGLISRACLRAPAFWLGEAALVATSLAMEWPLPDNHIYLLAYWCLAIGIALRLAEPPRVLARASRLLLGCAFAFAVVWKAGLSPDYRDGRFFSVTLLTDDRFADAAQLIGGLSDDDLAENRKYLTPLPDGAELLDPPRLHAPGRFRALVQVATWGTLALETLVAGLWLAPVSRRGLLAARHCAVLLFCLTTYAFAPVAGFGWLLLVMGLASCASDDRRLRAAYVASYGVVLLYDEVPWASLLKTALG